MPKKKPVSHTARSRAYYEALGYMVGRVDCTGSKRRPSHDLFGFADLVGFNRSRLGGGLPSGQYELDVVLIQVTSASNHAKHRTKILASEKAQQLELKLGGTEFRIELISWKKTGNRWGVRIESMIPLLRHQRRDLE